MRRTKLFVPMMFIGIGAAGDIIAPSIARADSQDFHLVQQSIQVDRTKKIATFNLTFNQPPSFVAVDNGQPQAFQYEIAAHGPAISDKPITFGDIDTIIRGGEIFEGQGIPLRQRDGEGGAHAGGWGPITAFIPFAVNDTTLTFTAPLADLGVNDGTFRYRVFTTDNGALTTDIQGAAVPLPAAAWSGLVVLGAMGATAGRRKLRRPRTS